MIFKGRPAHPDHLPPALEQLRRTLTLFQRGAVPPSIERWMIQVPMNRVMRALWGGKYRAAFALLLWAVRADLFNFTARWRRQPEPETTD